MRLPAEQLIDMVGDHDREVRLSVAARLPEPLLIRLINDPDYLIRATVARRLPHGQLAKLTKDPEREVRKVVASRLPPFALHLLAGPNRKSAPSSPNVPCPASPSPCCRTKSGGYGWPRSATRRSNFCRR
jgi:hypothetical protein